MRNQINVEKRKSKYEYCVVWSINWKGEIHNRKKTEKSRVNDRKHCLDYWPLIHRKIEAHHAAAMSHVT